MSVLSEHHKPKAGVTGKCSVPMWSDGCPSGFCDRPAYGEQFEEGSPWAPAWWSQRDRNDFLLNPYNRKPYAPGLACDHHGGPSETQTRFMKDGNMWHAFRPGFENLQESISGFGETQTQAFDDMTRLFAEYYTAAIAKATTSPAQASPPAARSSTSSVAEADVKRGD